MLKKLPLDPVRPVGVFGAWPSVQAGIHPWVQRENSGKALFVSATSEFTLFGNQFVAVGLEVP